MTAGTYKPASPVSANGFNGYIAGNTLTVTSIASGNQRDLHRVAQLSDGDLHRLDPEWKQCPDHQRKYVAQLAPP